MRTSSIIGRLAAIVALVVAVVAIVVLLGGNGDEYEVTAEFENASQLVKGNEVVVGGAAAGTVKEIELGPEGQALVTFTVDEEYAPLRAARPRRSARPRSRRSPTARSSSPCRPTLRPARRSTPAASSLRQRPSPRSTSTSSSTPSRRRRSRTSST